MKKEYYQSIRGICILMVLLIHTLLLTSDVYINYLNIIIRRIIDFAVPVFMFLSGYFVKYDERKSFFKKKITRIVGPLLIWNLIYGVTNIITQNVTNNIEKIKLVMLGGFHLYFLVVLLMLVIITPFLIKYIQKNNSRTKLYLPLLITLLYNVCNTIFYIKFNSSIPYYNYHIFGWFSYYYLGLLFRYDKIEVKSLEKINYLCFLSLMVSIIEGIFIYAEYEYYDLAVTQISTGNYIYCMALCLIIKNSEKEKSHKNILTMLGDFSYGIYLSHVLILMLIKKLVSYFDIAYFINITLTYILLVMITYILNYIYYKKIKKV